MAEIIYVKPLEAALEYAAKGWRVIPLHSPQFDADERLIGCSCKEGANCKQIGKHPRTLHGLKDATNDANRIALWWTQWPGANIGIATGEGSNLVVIDLDGDEGKASWARIEAKHGAVATLEAKTGGDGLHLLFTHPGATIKNRAGILPGVDVRGDGGYIVAAGSVHKSGNAYEWLTDVQPASMPVFLLDWLIGDIDPFTGEDATVGKGAVIEPPAKPVDQVKARLNGNFPKYVEAALRGEVERVRNAAEGTRNATLNRAGFALFQFVAAGVLDEGTVVDALTNAAEAVGLDSDETAKTLDSAKKAGMGKPRDMSKVNATKPATQPAGKGERPEIRVTGMEMKDVSAASVDALKGAGEVFVAAGRLVRVSRVLLKKNTPEVVGIETLDEDALLGMMIRSANYTRFTAKGDVVPAVPEMRVVKDILSQASAWGFPVLAGVVTVPTIRADGSILDAPGYDEATGLFYQPERGFDWPGVSEHPSPAEVEYAKAVIDELLCDFPFDTKASHDNAVALMVSMAARQMFDIAPMAGIDATQQSSGKSTLTELCCMAGAGESFPANGISKDDDETRKAITASLLSGARVIVFDNAEGVVGSDSLARAITAKVWGDRLLGANKGVSLPLDNTLFIVNGNNLSVTGDLATRIYPIRIAVDMARPQDRTTFRHSDVIGYARQQKGEAVAAVLTLIRAWVSAGKPEPVGIGWRFQKWVSVVGGVLQYAGYTDFLKNLRDFEERSDTQTPAWAAFIERLCAVFGKQTFTPSMLYLRIAADDSLRELMPAEMPPVTSDEDAKAKANFTRRAPFELRRWMDRRLGANGVKLVRIQDSHSKGYVWRVDCP